MDYIWTNNGTSRVVYNTDAGSPTVTVETGDGFKFPSPIAPQFFMVTVEDKRTGQMEIMRCTSRAGDVLTVVRAQEGTAAQSFAIGASVSNRVTAGTLADMIDFVNNSPGYTEAEADDRFVNVTGDTMQGPLDLFRDPQAQLEAATKRYVDNGLAGKASLHHTHPISDVVGLQDELDLKLEDAPLDGQTYARKDGAWSITVTKQEVIDGILVLDGKVQALDIRVTDLEGRVTAVENNKLSDAPDDGVMYGRQSQSWVAIPPGTAGVLISDTPPIVSGPGYLWLETDTAIMYARVRDIDSEQWVQVNNPPSSGGSGGGGIADAPADGNIYGRQNNAWSTIAESGFVGEAPLDGTPYSRQDAGWVPATIPLPPLPEAPNDGNTYTRGQLQWQVLTWNAIPGRPATFPPSAHVHPISQVTGLQMALDAKEPVITAGNTFQYWRGDKTWVNLPVPAIASDAPSDGKDYIRYNGAWAVMDWGNLDGKPDTFPPSAHVHAMSDVTGLSAALAGKENTITAGTTAQYWRGDKSWQTLPPPGISDAPVDGLLYARRDALWVVAGISFPEAPGDGQNYFRKGSTASWVVGTWANLGGKPATFPPSAHTHVAAEITDLPALLAQKENLIAAGTVNDFWRGDKTWQPTPVGFPEAPTDGLSYLRKGSTKTWEVGLTSVQGDARYVELAGDVMSGDLSIAKANPLFVLDKAGNSQPSKILGSRASSSRWAMSFGDATPETGSNAGSNFKLEAYADAGTLLATAFEIARSTQVLDFKKTPTVNGAPMIGGATISDTPPVTPVPGQFWWESDSGGLFLRFQDANSSQWVQVNTPGISDAPRDGNQYARMDGAWSVIADTGGGYLPLTGGTLTGVVVQTAGSFQTQEPAQGFFTYTAGGGVNTGYLSSISGIYSNPSGPNANGGVANGKGTGGGFFGYLPGGTYYGSLGYAGYGFYSNYIAYSTSWQGGQVYVTGNIQSVSGVGIFGGTNTTASSANCNITTGGGLYRSTASTRAVKRDIEPMWDEIADKILSLPTYWHRYAIQQKEPENFSVYSLMAEDCAAADPRFANWDRAVIYDENGAMVPKFEVQDVVNPDHAAWITQPEHARSGEMPPLYIKQEVQVGFQLADEDSPQHVNWNALVTGLINLVQRQDARIAKLEAMVSAARSVN